LIERLTEADARGRIERAARGTPALTVEDVDLLLSVGLVEEPDPPDEPNAGYDVGKAAAVGWEWRAGMLAEQRKIGAEGSSLENQQKFEHAMEMVRYYRAGGMTVTSGKFRRTDVIR
jgi:hypothetical protein